MPGLQLLPFIKGKPTGWGRRDKITLTPTQIRVTGLLQVPCPTLMKHSITFFHNYFWGITSIFIIIFIEASVEHIL